MVSFVAISPFILKPTRICNYTQCITLLRLKQLKYSDYSHGEINNTFCDVLSTETEEFVVEDIIDGFLHRKLVGHFEEYEKGVESEFNRFIEQRMREIKKTADETQLGIGMINVRNEEDFLFSKCTKFTFKDTLLYDLYVYLTKRKRPLDFLQESYCKYMREFLIVQKEEDVVNSGDISAMVSKYVQLRFNIDEFAIEAYNGRFLWAEVFILYRIGRTDLVKEILVENEMFFEFMGQKFKSAFLEHLSGNISNFVYRLGVREDKFKKMLFGIVDGNAKCDGAVIATIEDYLWMKMRSLGLQYRDISKDVISMGNDKILFMVYLLGHKYTEAVDVLLRGDFSFIAKFFLLREICLEFNCSNFLSDNNEQYNNCETSNKNYLSKPNEINKKEYIHENSVVNKNNTENSELKSIFLEYLFALCRRLSSNEKKVKLIETLRGYSDYYTVVPNYIIKYDLFEIIGKNDNIRKPYLLFDSANNISSSTSNSRRIYDSYDICDTYLDKQICDSVVQILMDRGAKNKLIKLWRLIPDDKMGEFLTDVLEESILLDEHVDTEIVENYINKLSGNMAERLVSLYGLYKFNKDPTIANIKNSIIFDSTINLYDYKFVVEKLLSKIIDVVKTANDHEMAKHIFKLGGSLNFTEESCDKIAKELVVIIQ